MPIRPNQAGSKPWLSWRRLVSALTIYALVLQPLLLTSVGNQLVQAAELDQIALSQLCLHNEDGSPVAPSDRHPYPADHHCVQCFAGAFHFLDAPQPVTVALVDQQFRKLRHAGIPLRLPSSSIYSAARPRGPPLNV
jgi:hypothetical protein